MKQIDRVNWHAKTNRLNEYRDLKIGMQVKDVDGHRGVVVKIVYPELNDDSPENHGAVYVWQSERMEYGADNCEHYAFNLWKMLLREENN